MDKAALLELLDDGHEVLRVAIDGLSDTAFDAEAMPGWRRRDIVAHIEWWEIHSARVVEALRAGAEPYPRDEPFDLDVRNEQTLAENRDRSIVDLRAGEAQAWVRLRDALEAASEADLFEAGRFGWLGGEALVGLVRGDTDEHWEEHLPHLR